jgi:hypothetical protein
VKQRPYKRPSYLPDSIFLQQSGSSQPAAEEKGVEPKSDGSGRDSNRADPALEELVTLFNVDNIFEALSKLAMSTFE